MVFPLVMYECESRTIKKAECWRINAFELWSWRRFLRVPQTAGGIQPIHPKGNQYWMFTWKDWCWSWNTNILATWCEELTHLKNFWCWERLKAGEGDYRGQDGWMASPTQWTWAWVNSGSWWWTGRPGMMQSMESQRVRHNWATELRGISLSGFIVIYYFIVDRYLSHFQFFSLLQTVILWIMYLSPDAHV